MSTPASNITGRVRNQLIDTGVYAAERFTDSELLGWIADGERTMVAVAPRVSQTRVVAPLVAGETQSIPTNGYMFLKAYKVLMADGVTPTGSLQLIERGLLDGNYPFWPAATQVASPVAVMFDPSDPTHYGVYPPSNGTGKIDLSYSVLPIEYANTSQNIVVQDIYATPLFDYVMYRACQKDSDYVAGQQIANTYMQSFQAFLKDLLADPLTQATQTGKI